MASKIDNDVNDLVGEPTLAGIWFRTRPLPWYARYVGPGTILEFFLLAAFVAYEYLRPASRTETETLLDYSGPIYCARTRDALVFIGSGKRKGARQLTRVFRRFPSSKLLSCDYEHSHTTPVKFRFDSGECFTLQFDGVWSDLDEFISPGSSLANPSEIRG